MVFFYSSVFDDFLDKILFLNNLKVNNSKSPVKD